MGKLFWIDTSNICIICTNQPFTGDFLIDVATIVGANSAFLLKTSGEDLLLQWPAVVAVGGLPAEDRCGKNSSEVWPWCFYICKRKVYSLWFRIGFQMPAGMQRHGALAELPALGAAEHSWNTDSIPLENKKLQCQNAAWTVCGTDRRCLPVSFTSTIKQSLNNLLLWQFWEQMCVILLLPYCQRDLYPTESNW